MREGKEILDAQWENLEAEKEAIERERVEAKKFIADQLPLDANILILDVGQDVFTLDNVSDRDLRQHLISNQFGSSEDTSYAAPFGI